MLLFDLDRDRRKHTHRNEKENKETHTRHRYLPYDQATGLCVQISLNVNWTNDTEIGNAMCQKNLGYFLLNIAGCPTGTNNHWESNRSKKKRKNEDHVICYKVWIEWTKKYRTKCYWRIVEIETDVNENGSSSNILWFQECVWHHFTLLFFNEVSDTITKSK